MTPFSLQLARIEARMAEVSATRQAIERETLADSEAVLHRLRSTEAGKLAALQGEHDALAREVMAVDRFYGSLQQYQPSAQAGQGGQSATAAALASATQQAGGAAGGAAGAPASAAAPAADAAAPGAAGGAAGAGSGGPASALSSLYNPSLALEFMRAYPELCAEADRLAAKPIKTEVSRREGR